MLGVLSLVGVAGLWLVVPIVDDAQPWGLEIDRAEARRIADIEARRIGIDVDSAWVTTGWSPAPIEQEIEGSGARQQAEQDPAMQARLGGYMVRYFRRGLDKSTGYGFVVVSRKGIPTDARRTERPEWKAVSLGEEEVRRLADSIVGTVEIPGISNPRLSSLRPTVLRDRTDYEVRYEVDTARKIGDIRTFLRVYYTGDQYAGWSVIDEKADGTAFTPPGGELAPVFASYLTLGTLLIALLIIFLRKYHAGEVGVRTAVILFFITLTASLVANAMSAASDSVFFGLGATDAPTTAAALVGFRLLFFDLPFVVMIFVGWAVAESYARERWGERLASFDSLVHLKPFNATTGASIIGGLLLAPFIAFADLALPALAISTGIAGPALGLAGPGLLSYHNAAPLLLTFLVVAIAIAVIGILFHTAALRRFRLVWLGVIIAALIYVAIGTGHQQIEPVFARMIFSFGSVLVAAILFFWTDLLTVTLSLFFGWSLSVILPFANAVSTDVAMGPVLWLAVPAGALALMGIAGLATRRETVYEYEDLAPHVKRIMERERVKAEIDAANRIQSALLPDREPEVDGIDFASHYRAATEIGGDYYDFLPRSDGKIGIAFGDVAGHGLTSGIVMAMAKSALLVQLEHDWTPSTVLASLNDIVIRTGPARMMMTFFFGILDPVSRTIRFSSAGHLDPYVYRADSGAIEVLSSWGYPLGIQRRDGFREVVVSFQPGDRMILYSDGLIEALDDQGEPFGFDRFEHVIRDAASSEAHEIRDALLRAVKKFTNNRPPEDDQTLLIVSFGETAGAAGRVA